MKYLEKPKGKKDGQKRFYITVISALAVIGIAAGVMTLMSKPDKKTEPPIESDSQNQSYTETPPSYTDKENEVPEMPATETETPKTDIPYEDITSETPAPAPQPQLALIMPLEGEIIKDFSDTALQFSATYSDLRLHTATDIEAKAKTAVLACGDGTVKSVGESGTLGKTVTIEHNSVTFKYCGLDKISVSEGQQVKMGDAIGTVGTVPSECADKSHLHLEAVKDGKAVSPMEYIGKLN